ncbi:phosphatase PAP2 family protein [Nocardioides mesophilus]|uniref:Inositol phosphorylceramide synthase n=1 Tax=Nocardioides mesophilus TaxID=433659 RepID=A0A7G9RDS8_9ACTN|nr:phosphatase PAP2 family protein [Nocardioides mesophilus]QNN53753.1 inositol phosphorylceramide synthase [Nocardioides mesophilus]
MGAVQLRASTGTSRSARVVSMCVYVAALACWVAVLGLPKQTLAGFLWIWLATIAWNIRAPWRSHLAFPLDWWPALAVLTLYVYSRGLADQLGFVSVHVSEPIRADRWLFGGTLPTEYLQAELCGIPCERTMPPNWYDVALTTVYYSFFFVPILTASLLWMRNRSTWVAFMRRYLSLNLVALVFYVTYPMAPPWMAAEAGFLPSDIDRITSRGWYDLGEVGVHDTLSALTNQVAAMPSLHAGITLLVALFGIERSRRWWRWLLLLYPLAMGFALVYYAEHYVVDVLAGFAVAGLVVWACAAWERWRRPAVTLPVGTGGIRRATSPSVTLRESTPPPPLPHDD